jgi:hypothetical protein
MRRHARLRWRRSLRVGDGNSSVLTSEKTLATGSSVIAAVEPAPIPRRVLYTFADVPLNAGHLVVSQIASTCQEHQRQSSERSFDNREHARDPPLISRAQGFRIRQADRLRKSPNRCVGATRGRPRRQRPRRVSRGIRAGGMPDLARRNFPSNTSLMVHGHGTGFGGWPHHWPGDGVCARVRGAHFHFISEAATRAAAAHGVTCRLRWRRSPRAGGDRLTSCARSVQPCRTAE